MNSEPLQVFLVGNQFLRSPPAMQMHDCTIVGPGPRYPLVGPEFEFWWVSQENTQGNMRKSFSLFRIRKILPAQKLWKRTSCSLHFPLMIGSIRCFYHTCKKQVIPVIYHRNFFWIFRKILGWEREINTAPKPSPEVAPSKMEVAPF